MSDKEQCQLIILEEDGQYTANFCLEDDDTLQGVLDNPLFDDADSAYRFGYEMLVEEYGFEVTSCSGLPDGQSYEL